LENGNKFYDKGRFKEASIMYRRALQKDARFGEAYYKLALADLSLNAYGDAVRALRRAVELQPNNSDAAVRLADIYVVAASQDPAAGAAFLKEARELAQGLLQQNPNSFEGHRLMGQMALMGKDAPTAIAEFRAAEAIKPGQGIVAMPYFQALANDKQDADAEKLGREFIGKQKDAAGMYDLLYLLYARQGKQDKAEEILKLKVDNNPKQANYLLQLATHYFGTRQRPQMDAVIARLTNEKDFPDGHMLAGDFLLFRARETENAKVQYEAGMKANPKDKPAYQKRLVELYASSNRPDDANRTLAEILKDNPKDTDAVAMRASMMLQSGNKEQLAQATTDLQGLVAKSPDNHLLRFNLARALVTKGDMDQARLQLEAAIKIRPDYVPAYELLGRVYLAKGDPSKALKQAEDAIKLSPGSLQARLIRSSALLGLNERDKARQELDYILKSAPDNADAKYQVGFLAWQDGDLKRAQAIFGDLYKNNPKDLRGLIGVVETLVSDKRLPEAITQMEGAVSRDSNRLDMKLALANLYVRANRFDDAIKIFQTLLQADPKSADLLFRLAETQRRKGDMPSAMDNFRKASAAAPGDTRPLVILGLLLQGNGRVDQAKPIYEQILKIEPDQPVALNNLAYIKAEEGTDLDAALTLAQRASQKLPKSGEIKDTLGWIYIKKNLSDDAARVFKELTTQEPANPTFHYHYGMALMQKGDKAQAKKELETAIKNNPSKDETGKIKQLLQTL
jgi:tetratricopeptide (TPR) repeat protein